MVLDRDLTSFKIISVIMALLVAAFVLMQSYVRADAIVFETLGAAAAALGGLSGLGLAAVAVVLVAMAVLGYSTSQMDLGGFSPEQIVRITDKAIQTIGVAQMTSLVNAIAAGELVLTAAIIPAWNSLLEFIRQSLPVSVMNTGEAISFADSGIRNIYFSDITWDLTPHTSSAIEVSNSDYQNFNFDFSSAISALVGLAASSAVGALYIYSVVSQPTAGNYRAFGVKCVSLTSLMGAAVDSSTPVYAFTPISFNFNTSATFYSAVTAKGLMDLSVISSASTKDDSFTCYRFSDMQNCLSYWIQNSVSFTWSDVCILMGTLFHTLESVGGTTSCYYVNGLPCTLYRNISGVLTSLCTSTQVWVTRSVVATAVMLGYANSVGISVLQQMVDSSIPFASWWAGVVELIFTGVTQREVAGEVQVGNVAGGVEAGGSVAIPLPNVDNPDVVIPIPDINELAPDIAATIPDIASEIAQPFIDVFVPIGDVIFNLPDIIGDFVSPAADSISGLAGAAEDAFGIFKFWYDWRDAA